MSGSLDERVACPSTFWWAVLGLGIVGAISFDEATLGDVAGFLLICASALLPAYLWCRRVSRGLPLFPIFTAGTIWTFGLPLISHHPLVIQYSDNERLLAAVAISATSLAGTLPWLLFTRRKPKPPGAHLVLRRIMGRHFFFAVLLATIAFNLLQLHLLDTVDFAFISMMRAAVIALSNLAIFILAHQWGRHELTFPERAICAALFVAVMISTLPSALMVNAISYGVLALIGFALGRGRVPLISVGALVATAFFLQGGKEQLREHYWYGPEAGPIQIADYPGMLANWVRFSLEGRSDVGGETGSGTESLAQRASLLQLFLRIQKMSGEGTPYLHGATYRIIPGLLVPRILNADKGRTHLGTYMMSMHYELQTIEDTYTTTIGFGLINEAMANFGYLGCVFLGAFLGVFYGGIARWCAGYPLLSVRMMIAILVLSVTFQNEFSASVYVTTLFQGGCAVLGLALVGCRRVRQRSITHPFPSSPRVPVPA